MNTRSFSTIFLLFALVASSLVVFSGCGDDEPEPDPVATVYFTNQVDGTPGDGLGIFVQDKAVVTLKENVLSKAFEVGLGENEIDVRLQGQDKGDLINPETFVFEERAYLVALTGSFTGGINLINFDADPGDVDAESHAVEVIDLRPSDAVDIKVFVGGTSVADKPTKNQASPFVSVPLSEASDGKATIGVSNADTGAPISSNTSIDLTGGKATMIIIGGADSAVEVNALPLN